MRKKVSVLAVCLISLISVLIIPTALAKKPTQVSGILYYMPYIDTVRLSGVNVILETHEEGTWTGDIEGESYDYPCRVVVHDADGWPPTDFKFRWYTAIATLDVCTVAGKTGGLVMRLAGKDKGPGTEWSGKWVIIEGTDQLAGIHGQGTWSGPGFVPGVIEPGVIPYEGWVHFDP